MQLSSLHNHANPQRVSGERGDRPNSPSVRKTISKVPNFQRELTIVAYPECARGGGVSHILAEKRGVSFTVLKKMHENSIFSPIRGEGAYDGYALCWIRH